MADVLYAPVLKGRQGELAALSMIQPVTRRHALPVLEIMPPADEVYAAAALRRCGAAVGDREDCHEAEGLGRSAATP